MSRSRKWIVRTRSGTFVYDERDVSHADVMPSGDLVLFEKGASGGALRFKCGYARGEWLAFLADEPGADVGRV